MSEIINQNPSDNASSQENEKLTLGIYIKRAREAKQIGLNDLARENRMPEEYLVALEAGNYAALPGDTYVRAYLKSIAKRLQLEESKIITWYLNETKQEVPHDLDHVIEIVNEQPHDTEKLHKGNLILLIVVVVVLFVLAQLFHVFNSEEDAPPEINNPSLTEVTTDKNLNSTTSDSNNTESIISEDSLSQDSLQKKLDSISNSPKEQEASKPSDIKLSDNKPVKTILSLSTKSDSTWIAVKAKDSKQFAIWLRKGQKPQYLTRKDTITLEVGHPELVELKLNGQITSITNPINKIYDGKVLP